MSEIIFDTPTIGLYPMQKFIVEYWRYVYVLWWSIYATSFLAVLYYFLIRPYVKKTG